MALGLSTGGNGGDFLPRVQYDARAGRWTRIDRSNAGGTWTSEPTDITQQFSAVFDLENIQVGWISYTPPSFVMKPLGQDIGAKPGEKFKQGFQLTMKLAKACSPDGNDVRTFSSTAGAVIGAIDELHEQYLAGVKENPGMLPVVSMTGVKAIVTKTPDGKTTNYAPVLKIERWCNRPADLKQGAGGGDANAMPKQAPQTGATPVGPPPSKQPATNNAEDFG